MPKHDEYGKEVLKRAVGEDFCDSGSSTEIDYGSGQPARIDGTIGKDIAVEIESRVSKQVRGAVLDLIFHSYPKKLLVLLPVHMSNPQVTSKQCQFILSKFIPKEKFRIVVLQGTGESPKLEEDIEHMKLILTDFKK